MVLEGEHNRGSEDFWLGLREDEVVALDLEGFMWYEMVEMREREKKMSLLKGTFWAGAWTPPRTCTWPWWGSLMCDTAGADNAVEWEQSGFSQVRVAGLGVAGSLLEVSLPQRCLMPFGQQVNWQGLVLIVRYYCRNSALSQTLCFSRLPSVFVLRTLLKPVLRIENIFFGHSYRLMVQNSDFLSLISLWSHPTTVRRAANVSIILPCGQSKTSNPHLFLRLTPTELCSFSQRILGLWVLSRILLSPG